ncbi:unnamed protein product [Allacma fusca]|uniref:Uncharacterized protein n=1 Tax=Allacma fusca TaxID=39272 RepID=A0A8J2PWH7_9HEXA|nr:unnamed protein product [Allacma fusca]
MESKYLIGLIFIFGCIYQGSCAPPSKSLRDAKLRDARQALDQAEKVLQNNLITALVSLSNPTAKAGTNVSKAANVLIRDISSNYFSLVGVVGYLPKLILMDGPTQFVETLKLVRANQIRAPNDVNSAIDTLIAFANQQRDSGIGNNFTPVVTFLPNLFKGVGDYLTTVIDSVFTIVHSE